MTINVIFDMETRDPDDMFALCFLGSHPNVALQAVTINPGTKAQVGVIRHILHLLNKHDVPVGARNSDSMKDVVSEFHYEFLGIIPPKEPDDFAHNLIATTINLYPDVVLLTGAPLHNLRLLLKNFPLITIKRWVGQGGFAGDSIVPPQLRLPKFNGLETCLTFNFNGDPKAALALLSSARVMTRDIVSKNVCHGVIYHQEFHERMKPFRNNSIGLNLIYNGMELYLKRRPEGKMFHDPLAACITLNRNIAQFQEVEIYRKGGEWGANLAKNTNTFITITIDHNQFFQTLTQS
ncbi:MULTISPECIES: nucleoside hydrolase [Nostocales]|uniref:Nucleoside hydrolase n=3 Tax=Nostocales TaxID=1161 RepID=A0A0C1NHP0_9CYAN|nr:nucleoside hydrolase [Tolypothrix bouteillei]KAF3890291.1 nucleoside hydrolase [Tolypothrix bouteillei VB521301]